MGVGSLGLALVAGCLWSRPGWALPGLSIPLAEAWMRSNATLDPGPEERLLIQRWSTPAQRFTFEASVFPVTGLTAGVRSSHIRTERFALVDYINGMTPERLEESLRAIYGSDVFTDYRQAELLLAYPVPESSVAATTALVLQGELRAGEQFAYWKEMAYDQSGNAISGRMAVFLKDDLPLLQEQLLETRLSIEP